MSRQTNPIIRAIEHPTFKNAIHAKCAECFGCEPDHLESGFRESIAECKSYTCPLRPFRPYQKNPSYKNLLASIHENECQGKGELLKEPDKTTHPLKSRGTAHG